MGWSLTIGIALPWLRRRQSTGSLSFPVLPPTRLRWVDKTTSPTGVVFSWDAAPSFGSAGPRGGTGRYRVDYRHASTADGTAFPSATPYLRLAEYTDALMREVSDGGGQNDAYVRFRVRSESADGSVSDWLTSPALAYEGAQPARRPGPFSRQFSRQFHGGGG